MPMLPAIKRRLPIATAIWGVAIFVLPTAVFALEHAAHVHGKARMEIAVEGAGFSVHLETPLHDLVGFEHAPHTDKERAAIKAAVVRLRQPAQLMLATAAAGCQPDKVTLSSPVINAALLGETATESHASDNDGHAELEADFSFRCTQPGALRGITVEVFKHFLGIQRIQVQIAGPKGQSARTLTPASRQLNW